VSKPVVAYIRVSTARQGRSGLGLKAQQAAIGRFCEAEGFEVVAEHVEVETDKGADALDRRPELAKALAARRFFLPVCTLCETGRSKLPSRASGHVRSGFPLGRIG
jgi:hypothetical protein